VKGNRIPLDPLTEEEKDAISNRYKGDPPKAPMIDLGKTIHWIADGNSSPNPGHTG
jgi:hypothetical protein